MDVMPIWMVDRNRVGSSPSLAAAMALLSPASMCFCNRALRAVTSAISDIAKMPLMRISRMRIVGPASRAEVKGAAHYRSGGSCERSFARRLTPDEASYGRGPGIGDLATLTPRKRPVQWGMPTACVESARCSGWPLLSF